MSVALREKCPYSEFFWCVFSRIWTEYRKILRISPYSVQMRENTAQKNSKNRHFSRSVGSFSTSSRIRTEYRKILRISPYSVQMRENMAQKNSKNRHFSRSVGSLSTSGNIRKYKGDQ